MHVPWNCRLLMFQLCLGSIVGDTLYMICRFSRKDTKITFFNDESPFVFKQHCIAVMDCTMNNLNKMATNIKKKITTALMFSIVCIIKKNDFFKSKMSL